MKDGKKIKDIDTLEKEIYRLKFEALKAENKLDNNLEFLQRNYSTLIFNSFFDTEKNGNGDKPKYNFFRNGPLNSVISDVTDHIAEKASNSIKDKIDKLFGKK